MTRLLAVIAVSLPGGAGCFTSSSCPLDADPTETESCFDPSESSDAGAGDGGAQIECPSRADAKQPLENANFISISEMKGGPTVKDGQCCYQVLAVPICEGRPYMIDDVARTAAPVRGPRGSARGVDGPSPSLDLDPVLRAELAARWVRDARFEHASIASFGRFALELLAVGAPVDRVEDAHRAALDEARHAKLCFALASAYAGEAIEAGPFPFDGQVPVSADLASFAARTAREGCVGETIAATIAAEQLAGAIDPAVRAALTVIAEDEARHAELAWRTVAWAIRVGGPRVTSAVAAVFSGMGAIDLPAPCEADLVEHGRLGSDATRSAAERAIGEIVMPAARALLAAAESLLSPTATA